jgi:cytoskeleton protein RodZ
MAPSGQALKTGIGAALRAERQRRHISLDAVARGTLVRQDFLELIDHDRLEELPTGAYAKGFIRSYVAYLGLDPKPFLDAYEKRCGRPEPELSRVVRRGVRVPPAAQKRGWQIAVGSAVVLILILGLFGAFRSGDSPDELPSASAAAARVPAASAPNAMGAVVRLEVVADETWVEASVDGQKVFGANLARGEYETFKGNDRIDLFVARGENVRITANGRILGTPDEGPYSGGFTPSTTRLPSSEPEPTIEPASDAPPSPGATAVPADGTQ